MKEHSQIKKEFDAMRSDRSNFDAMYQVIGEYVAQNRQNFTGQPSNGEFLTKDIFDTSGVFAAYTAASTILGMLWPGSAKQAIEIDMPDDMESNKELADFYQRATKKLVRAMDDPRAGLSLALGEYMFDQILFGTSGIGVEEGDESTLLYKPYGVKEIYIDEGKNGRVSKLALYYEWDVERVVAEYGIDNVSEKVRKAYEKGGKDKVKILIYIKPRKVKRAKIGKLAMDFEGLHFEYDCMKLLREDGYHEFPIPVVRFHKLMYEKMGRSLAMNALPDIREANVLREAVIIATEKTLDMPIGVMDDSMLGGGYIDTSARAVTVFNASSNVSGLPPVFNIGDVPKIDYAEARLEKLENNIAQHFHIDRLLDFNNETQMTFGEAQIRDQIRTASLVGLFSRQISEGFTEWIRRGINIMWRKGEFGVIKGSVEEQERIAADKEVTYLPDEIVRRLKKGLDIYQITYKTKAANAAKAEEYIGIVDVLGFAKQMADMDQSIVNRVDLHKAIKRLAEIRGASSIIRQDDEVEAMQASQEEQQQQLMQLQQAEQLAGAAEKVARAESYVQ